MNGVVFWFKPFPSSYFSDCAFSVFSPTAAYPRSPTVRSERALFLYSVSLETLRLNKAAKICHRVLQVVQYIGGHARLPEELRKLEAIVTVPHGCKCSWAPCTHAGNSENRVFACTGGPSITVPRPKSETHAYFCLFFVEPPAKSAKNIFTVFSSQYFSIFKIRYALQFCSAVEHTASPSDHSKSRTRWLVHPYLRRNVPWRGVIYVV